MRVLYFCGLFALANAAALAEELRIDSTSEFEVYVLRHDRDQPQVVGRTPSPDGKGIVVRKPKRGTWGLAMPSLDTARAKEIARLAAPAIRIDESASGIELLAGLEQLLRVEIRCEDLSDANLGEVVKLKQLKALQLVGCDQLTEAGVERIATLPDLRWLELIFLEPKLTDEVLTRVVKSKKLTRLALSGGEKLTPSGLKQLAGLPRLRHLDVSSCGVTDEVLVALEGLKSLQAVYLIDDPITDAGLASLSKHEGLKKVFLGLNPKVTDEGVVTFAGLKELTHLSLFGTQVTDRGLASLAGLEKLEFLMLGDCVGATGGALRHFEASRGLKRLYVNGLKVSDADLKRIAGFKKLEVLDLGKAAGYSSLAALATLPELRKLDLSSAPDLTDSMLEGLLGAKALRELNLSYTTISDEAMRSLTQLDLVSLDLSSCPRITASALAHLVRLERTLERLDVSSCEGIPEEDVQGLRKHMPNCEIEHY